VPKARTQDLPSLTPQCPYTVHRESMSTPTRLTAIRDILGHRFADPALLLQACTHASMVDANAGAGERLQAANERLEFLGDTKANLAESILAAIYLDGGWDAVRQAVAKLLDGFYDDVDTAPPPDVKNQLQQWALEHHKTLPDYSSERSGGSDHAPEFNCQVSVGGHSATGTGTSRRRAEAAAASALLSEVGVLE
jgi:dsRNA-specific ribonuclease